MDKSSDIWRHKEPKDKGKSYKKKVRVRKNYYPTKWKKTKNGYIFTFTKG